MSNATEELERPSLAQAIADLEIGRTYAIAERLDGDHATKEVIKDCIVGMRNLISPAVARAKKRSDGEFTVETGTFFTRTLDIIVTAAITRVS